MDNSTLPQLQPSFLGVFPLEIAAKIFSYMSQEDCMNAMGVCRLWYSTVPQYSRATWAKIKISIDDKVYQDNKRWKMCLGSHVKSVAFVYDIPKSAGGDSGDGASAASESDTESSEDDADTYDESSDSDDDIYDAYEMGEGAKAEHRFFHIMQKLIDCGCDQVKALEFKNCLVTSQRAFLLLLKQLAQTATELKFHGHRTGPYPINFLDSCPHLTSFSFRHGDYSGDLMGEYVVPPKFDLTNLKRLSVEIRDSHDMKNQLIPVLEKSPNLEHLACRLPDRYDSDRTFYDAIDLPADRLASWCPKLISLELSSLEHDSDEEDAVQQYPSKTSDGSPGLRILSATETDFVDPDFVGPFILHNASTLESISLTKEEEDTFKDWSRVLRRAEFPNLRSLELYEIEISNAATNKLLMHSPALERLYIYAAENPPMIRLAQALRNLPQLKTIEFQSVQLADDDYIPLVASKSKIEHVEFREVIPVTDTLLQRLPLLQSLKRLHLSFPDITQDHTDAGLFRLIEMLSDTKLQMLHLEGLQTLQADAIQALGNLPYLEWMTLCGSEVFTLQCDGPSLVQVLDNCKSLKWAKFSHIELINNDMNLLDYLKQGVKAYKEVKYMPTVRGVCITK